MIGLGDAFRAAEEFVRRHIKTKAVRDAEKRRQERRQRQAMQNAKKAGAVAGVFAVGAFGVGIAFAPVTSAALAAGAAAVAGLAASGLLPKRRTSSFSREELAALPGQAEEWLLDQRMHLPQTAAAAIDAILVNLGDLPPHLGRIDPGSSLAWDARKLLGEHLPNLVQAWCNLPSQTRETDVETRVRFERGLGTIAEEVARLTHEASRDERMRVETHGRYLDARYRDDLGH
ncbi:hypothetical protein E2493_11035 [Sphingomonas parva]|uniref:Uncharacterized protein n=1 Tax=Sphingomonas parva TaxID=2555898 RepID=A0A4Y8ZQ80_9SPHN|nr:hypothetical protein [Sphingomonas parva]TFI58114.1 hypothetical protein E2493_11035 [Sphingomonas parva]